MKVKKDSSNSKTTPESSDIDSTYKSDTDEETKVRPPSNTTKDTTTCRKTPMKADKEKSKSAARKGITKRHKTKDNNDIDMNSTEKKDVDSVGDLVRAIKKIDKELQDLVSKRAGYSRLYLIKQKDKKDKRKSVMKEKKE